ncbi:MAG: hypothetical protein BAA03_07535 [Caldibacillus debilis]|nr:MAG: hypothetical protein BAA03_07535 [Caldibacillus debilis]
MLEFSGPRKRMQAKAMSPQPGRFVVGCGGIFFWPKEKGEAAPGGPRDLFRIGGRKARRRGPTSIASEQNLKPGGRLFRERGRLGQYRTRPPDATKRARAKRSAAFPASFSSLFKLPLSPHGGYLCLQQNSTRYFHPPRSG